MNQTSQHKQVIAFDVGLVNIGVAVGNTIIRIAHPLEIISESKKFVVFNKIDQVIKKWRPQLLVVGILQNQQGKNELLARLNKFVNKLRNNYNLPIVFINEDYSSLEAGEMLSQQGVTGYNQKNQLDDLAACVILQRYFDNL